MNPHQEPHQKQGIRADLISFYENMVLDSPHQQTI